MKGVILAGGNGTRLRPLTYVANKHLLPVFDKPMICYPLETLKSFGIQDILIVSGGEHIGWFTEFLGDGSAFGVKLTYKVQNEAGGIAQALSLAEEFVGNNKVVVILGDNVFSKFDELDLVVNEKDSAKIWVKFLKKDANRFGVLTGSSSQNNFKIIEKPTDTTYGWVVTGLYMYPPDVFEVIKTLKPSSRGELEITDVNNYYLENKRFEVRYLYEKHFWSDAGTFDSLLNAANWVADTFDGTQPRDAMRHAKMRQSFNARQKELKEKGVRGVDVLYSKLPLKQFKYWKIVENDFPYDRIALVHHLLIPMRLFKDDWDMTKEEREELWEIKRTVTGYKAMTENFPDRKSVSEVYHIHLLAYDE